jgi:hypothetical protein
VFSSATQIWGPLPLVVIGAAALIAFALVFLNSRRRK